MSYKIFCNTLCCLITASTEHHVHAALCGIADFHTSFYIPVPYCDLLHDNEIKENLKQNVTMNQYLMADHL